MQRFSRLDNMYEIDDMDELDNVAKINKLLSKFKRPRVCIGLYALDGALKECGTISPDDYYWAIIIVPKKTPKGQPCVRYRIKKRNEILNSSGG